MVKRMRRTAQAALASIVVVMALISGAADYTVEAGDTLSGIAAEHHVGVSALVAANELHDADIIYVGQVLQIPPREHVVRPGETLSGIARSNGISLARLIRANGIIDPSIIYAGATLRLSGEAFVAGDAAPATVHSVRPGETLSHIAVRYGTTIAALVARNAITDPDRILAGTPVQVAGWVCPVAGASYISSWGFPRSGGRLHQGNDLMAPIGTTVRAPVSGTVTQLTGRIGGHQFLLRGDDGHVYIGTHMSRPGPSGRVAAGAIVGYVGDTGNAEGGPPHLHFEIRPNGGAATDPYPTLQANGC